MRSLPPLAFAFACVLALPFPAPHAAEEAEFAEESVAGALQAGDYDAVIAATAGLPDGHRGARYRAAAFQRRGEERFFDADIEGAIADFDAFLEMHPERDPHHWQRGLAYYYAGAYEEGRAQFERHQTVNSRDVENAVWHFLCAVRAEGGGFEAAREGLIPIEGDSRVPMAEVHDLFAGTGTVEDVLAAARPADPDAPTAAERNHLCYAHLYLALYHEARGEEAKSAAHIRRAAFDYAMDHYMGRTAQLHARLRGVGPEGE